MRRPLLFLLLIALQGLGRLGGAPAGAEAVLVVTGDMHSAYERTARFVALVDRVKAGNPGLPLAILLNGDTQEYGNSLARRSVGEIDLALQAALVRRAPTILNLGNHDADYFALEETVLRAEAVGVRVVGNIVNRSTGRPFAPAAVPLKLGAHEATVVGLATDALATYRVAVRPSLDLANPVVWARENFPRLLASAGERVDPNASEKETGAATKRVEVNALHPLPIVLSHCGLAADKELLALVPDGTLFSGAHSHLRFVEPFGRTRYFHSGSWTQHVSLAWLCREESGGLQWRVEQVPVPADGPEDPELAGLIREVRARHLTDEERAIIGQTKRAMDTAEAAQFVAQVLREGAGAEAAFVGNTTFGAGLPAGDVAQLDFDACVRFDGPVYTAVMDGTRLQALLAASNQGPETPFAQRNGEFNFASGPAEVEATRRYRIATTDWGAKNTARYFGEPAIAWTERPGLRLKALVRARLVRDRVVPFPEPVAAEDNGGMTLDTEAALELGRQLFETYAPDEIKEAFEFPSKQEWDDFAARLQAALESNDLRRLAAYEPEARAALVALRALPDYQDYADWLAERLDYITAAGQTVATPTPKPRPAQPTPPPVPSGPAATPVPPVSTPAPPDSPPPPGKLDIPSYALWLDRMKGRAIPSRASALLPRVQKVFVEEGVPAELAWLAESESTFNPAARSPVGAKGLFQLMPETAKRFGLQTFLPDERTDTEMSARAAAQYLRYLYGRFGDWPLALAAYNAGEGRVGRTLKKVNARTFAEIAEALPAETRMYVPKVLATIEVRAGVPPEELAGPRRDHAAISAPPWLRPCFQPWVARQAGPVETAPSRT
jgi:2',3'-cyclic-nucleotide 2'-phosphodiesterase (5'-nucleotidase family)